MLMCSSNGERRGLPVDLSRWDSSDGVFVRVVTVSELLMGVHRANSEVRIINYFDCLPFQSRRNHRYWCDIRRFRTLSADCGDFRREGAGRTSKTTFPPNLRTSVKSADALFGCFGVRLVSCLNEPNLFCSCLLYTSPSPRDRT